MEIRLQNTIFSIRGPRAPPAPKGPISKKLREKILNIYWQLCMYLKLQKMIGATLIFNFFTFVAPCGAPMAPDTKSFAKKKKFKFNLLSFAASPV